MRRLGLDIAVIMATLLLAAMGVFAAVGFAALALYFYLLPLAGAAAAALVTALAALLFVMLMAAIAAMIVRRPRRPVAKEFGGLADALGLGQSLGTEGRDYLASHLSKASMVAFALGVAMGVSPKLRKLVTDLLLR